MHAASATLAAPPAGQRCWPNLSSGAISCLRADNSVNTASGRLQESARPQGGRLIQIYGVMGSSCVSKSSGLHSGCP